MKNFIWKPDERMFHSGECLWLGAYIVAGISWKSGTKDDPDSSGPRCYILLPGIKPKDLPHKKDEQAKSQAERLVLKWLTNAGLE